MKARKMQRLLERVLLAGAPFAVASCLAESSCPDNGVEPPDSATRAVDPSLANGGPLDAQQCLEVCGMFSDQVVTCVRETETEVLCFTAPLPCEGRRPPGLVETTRAGSGMQRHLADAAWLEAASVDAFRILRRELRAHGAPRRLLRALSRSARDERRHARAANALATQAGASPAPVKRQAVPARSLAELALENATEGCVRETWGALIALRQSRYAAQPAVRATLRRIARDEARHAELAFRIDDWLCRRLSAEQRRRVVAAKLSALAELERDAISVLPAADRHLLGLPSAREASTMLAELTRALRIRSA